LWQAAGLASKGEYTENRSDGAQQGQVVSSTTASLYKDARPMALRDILN